MKRVPSGHEPVPSLFPPLSYAQGHGRCVEFDCSTGRVTAVIEPKGRPVKLPLDAMEDGDGHVLVANLKCDDLLRVSRADGSCAVVADKSSLLSPSAVWRTKNGLVIVRDFKGVSVFGSASALSTLVFARPVACTHWRTRSSSLPQMCSLREKSRPLWWGCCLQWQRQSRRMRCQR